MAKQCAKCGCKIGFFGGTEYNGKQYCDKCFSAIPKPKNYGKTCFNCAYYGVNDNYDGYCKFDHNKYVDMSNQACKNFQNK